MMLWILSRADYSLFVCIFMTCVYFSTYILYLDLCYFLCLLSPTIPLHSFGFASLIVCFSAHILSQTIPTHSCTLHALPVSNKCFSFLAIPASHIPHGLSVGNRLFIFLWNYFKLCILTIPFLSPIMICDCLWLLSAVYLWNSDQVFFPLLNNHYDILYFNQITLYTLILYSCFSTTLHV